MLSNLIHTVTIGSLLHDIGKVIHRSGNHDGRQHGISGADFIKKFTENEDILYCIRYHHRQEIGKACLKPDSPAYIVYLADNISAGLDRREIEGESTVGFDKNKKLDSIYNLLNNHNGELVHSLGKRTKGINFPETDNPSDLSSAYSKIVADYEAGLNALYFQPEYINSLLELNEATLSYVPSSTHKGQVSDISLFDHTKTTAGLAACIAAYLENLGHTNFKEILFTKEQDFYNEKVFGILALDISGIQQFIYNISTAGALKALRSRSFFLEIMLENIADEILSLYSLSRANLLYTGGGHAYLLLPNVQEIEQQLTKTVGNMNRQLMSKFGIGLYIAHGYQPCSANELMSRTNDPESYTNIYRNVTRQISARKLRRYSVEDLIILNSEMTDKNGRECCICGASGDLKKYENQMICAICASFTEISNDLIRSDVIFAVVRKSPDVPSLPLCSAGDHELFVRPLDTETARKMLQNNSDNIVRLYSKNRYRTGLSLATNLWMGDYAAMTREGALKTFEELAESSQGIKRIGVLRADVDSLGMAFLRGFVRDDTSDNKYRYVTISRTSTLSRSLSFFFKYGVNEIIDSGSRSLITGKEINQLDVVVVYSGGDDMFIVGAWDHVLALAVEIRQAFSRYTGGVLSLSAGFAVFDPKYPIARMAKETGVLEEKAKQHQYKGKIKNSVSLFGLEMEDGYAVDKHTYDWDTLESKVLGEKLAALRSLFEVKDDSGNSFLYNILYLLRQAETEKINIARLAYLLTRHEPDKRASEEVKNAYTKFTKQIYGWALDPQERCQLITALIIYVYSKREGKGGE